MHFLVLQHSEIDHPGIFRDFMGMDDIGWDPIDMHLEVTIPSLNGYDGLIVMGGPQQADEEHLYPWLAREKVVIRDAVESGMPLLGVCLGCQLLAEAVGGQVGVLAEPEIGVLDVELTSEGAADPLFAGFPARTRTMQWHLNAVAVLPPGAYHLARSAGCEVQAFRVGRAAYGVQFHMELTADLVRDTGIFPEYVAALEELQGKGALQRFVEEAGQNAELFETLARLMFDNFVRLAGHRT